MLKNTITTVASFRHLLSGVRLLVAGCMLLAPGHWDA